MNVYAKVALSILAGVLFVFAFGFAIGFYARWDAAGGWDNPGEAACWALADYGMGSCADELRTVRNLEIAYERGGIDGK